MLLQLPLHLHIAKHSVWLFVGNDVPKKQHFQEDAAMRKWILAATVAVSMVGTSGCSMFRAIDQWKCDNLGCCMFGTTPSRENVYLAPAPVGASPCCTPMTVAPTSCAPAPCAPAY